MSVWDHIDQLRARLKTEKAVAVAQLKELKFTGNVDGRLEFDGTHWVFPVSGEPVKSRTLDGLVAAVKALRPPPDEQPPAKKSAGAR